MLSSLQSQRGVRPDAGRPRVQPAARKPVVVPAKPFRPASLRVQASTLVPNMPNSNEEGHREAGFSPSMGVPSTTMRGGGNFGSGASMGATMERSKLNFVMPTPVVQGPKLDDGGSGGDIGKFNRNGGGGGGGGDDDDDDFFNEEDGDGEGEGGQGASSGFFRSAIPESYDKLSLGAVFAEWMRTMADLPAILRQAVQMGLFSSAQLVRFFAMDVRPNLTRTISRTLPPSVARDFVGRLMADPGFVQKLVMEAGIASAASLWYEYRARGDKMKEEWDLALINTLGMAAATSATVWMLAPSRSYGSIQKFPWQQMLDGLPNCVFDVSGPLRQYSKQARAAGFLAKMAELSMVGALAGGATSLLSQAAVAVRQRSDPEWQPSVEVPSLGRSSAGLAAFFALNANTRYQIMGGLDRLLFDRTTFLWTYVALSGAGRLISNQIGELSRPWWQGLPSPSTFARLGAGQPVVKRISKKVKKRVPRSQVQQQQRQQVLELAATAAVVLGGQTLEGNMSQLQAAMPLISLEQAQEPLHLHEAAHMGDQVAAPLQSHPLETAAQAELAASHSMADLATQAPDAPLMTGQHSHHEQQHQQLSQQHQQGLDMQQPPALPVEMQLPMMTSVPGSVPDAATQMTT